MASPVELRSQLRSRRDPADEENVQPVSEADHRAIEWLRSQGIDPRDFSSRERVDMYRQRDVPPFDPSAPEERYANSPDEWTGNYDPIPYRPNGLGPVGASPGWRPSDHDARTQWYDEQYGHWGSLIRQLEGGQDWGPYRRLEAAQRLEQLGPDLVEQYGHGFDPTAGIEGGDYTGERDTRVIPGEIRGGDAFDDWTDEGAWRSLLERQRGDRPPFSDTMPLPFLEPRTEEERAADQSMAADRARQQGGGTPPPSAARRWGITPPPLRMTTAAAEMPGPNTQMAGGGYRDQFGKIAGGWGQPSTGTTGGFRGKDWYLGNQEGPNSQVQTASPEGPTPLTPLQSQKGREGPKKSPADVRFPIQAVLDQTGMSLRELARQIGANPSQLRDPRGLTVDQADRVAVALGVHPIDIWPDFHAGIDTSDVQPQSTNAAEGPIVPPNTLMAAKRYSFDPVRERGVTPYALDKQLGGGKNALQDPRGVTTQWAERIAQALGVHPTELWPDYANDPKGLMPGPNTAMSSSVPYEGDRPPFPSEWDVNNPEDRRRHFEQVYGSLLDNLVGSFPQPEDTVVKPEDLPRVGPGSAYSQGRGVVRPGDLGLPPWWNDDGSTDQRRAWLVQHPEYQVAQDFTDQQDYPVDIPSQDDPMAPGSDWRHTWFGGDEFDRYWAGPQKGVSKADQATVYPEQQSRKGPPVNPVDPNVMMGMRDSGLRMPGPNTAMGRTLPTGDEDMRPWWLRLLDAHTGGPAAHTESYPVGGMLGNVTPLYDQDNPPPDELPGPNTAMAGASSQPYWRSMLHGWGNGNTAMSTTTPDGGDEPIIPDWMTPQDVTDFWNDYPPMPDPTNPQGAHPSMGGGGALPPGYKPYVPGEQPEPTTHIEIPGAWDYNGEPMRVPVDSGYDDRHVEMLQLGDQLKEWQDAVAEADRTGQPHPPPPGGNIEGGGALSAMGGGAAVPRGLGGFRSAYRPRALGGYQPARPMAPLGGFGHPRSLPPMGGFGSRGAGVPSSTSMNPLMRSFQSGPRHEPFDGLLEAVGRNSGNITKGTLIGLGAVALGAGRMLNPFGGGA